MEAVEGRGKDHGLHGEMGWELGGDGVQRSRKRIDLIEQIAVNEP